MADVMPEKSTPTVSVIVGCRNVVSYIDDAIWSVRRQTLHEIELIVVDDASTDDTAGRVAWHAEQDLRVRLIRHPHPQGPAGSRNAALREACGEYVAILDGDDFMHPRRLATLVDDARRSGAEIVADDLFAFHDDPQARRPYFLVGNALESNREINAGEFILSNRLFTSGPALGYLKPLMRLDFIRAKQLEYDLSLRIGEDYHLLLEAIAAGARLRLLSEALYFYRRHSASISYRLSEKTLVALAAADDAFRKRRTEFAARHEVALNARRRSLARAMAFQELVSAVKDKKVATAVRIVVRQPSVVPLLAKAAFSGLQRRVLSSRRRQSTYSDADDRNILLVSRQRVAGSTNGSSAYLILLARALVEAGYTVDFLAPSPVVMGRWPWLRLRPEMRIFRSITIRRCVRLGGYIIYPSARTALAAARTLFARLLARMKIDVPGLDPGPAPYAIAAPWAPADHLFLARRASPSRVILADYIFQLPALAYALQPRAPGFVVMHDLFSRRRAQFRAAGSIDSVALVNEDEELSLMSLADTVVAIQQEEADFVRRKLPAVDVILAPMGAEVATAATPGDNGALLFVGSGTAPNVVGLRWFFNEVWPRVRKAQKDATLLVAGSVGPALGAAPEGVRLLGLVPDLAPLYREAAVVISPLTVGSGLKIKLIEAMAAGKAIVATSVTLQGVEEIVAGAVAGVDEPEDFAAAIIELLRDRDRRLALAEASRRIAELHFSPTATMRTFVAAVMEASGRATPQRMPNDRRETSADLVRS